jgi:hypothetical protein
MPRRLPERHYYAATAVFLFPMVRRLLPLVAVLAVAAPAQAQERQKRPRLLWATVNICDSEQSPDTLGVRASIPGSGRRTERMYMRFRAQWFSEQDDRWRDFRARGFDSGWVSVGSARFRARQSGWSFPLRLDPGQRFTLRAVVRFEWRRGRRVVRREVRRTRSGHRTDMSEPRGYSAASCVISG